MYIDSHLHLSSKDYSNTDIETVINDALTKNVKYLIISCCTLTDLDEYLDIVNKYKNVFMCLGLHPSESKKYTKSDLIKIEKLIKENKKIIAVGEIGLDYYYGKDDIEYQKELFVSQLEIAKRLDKPVVIHTRNATEDTINILKKYDIRGVIHCFSGSLETAKDYISMGYLLGIGGVVTFKNSKLPDIISKIDLDNIILETDSPYLSPEPFRGIQNQPKNIPIIAVKISMIKNISLNEVANKTTQNVIDMFDLKDMM